MAAQGATTAAGPHYTATFGSRDPDNHSATPSPFGRNRSMKRSVLLGTAIALAFGAGLATQSMVGAQAPVPPKDVIKEEALVGGNSENMVMQLVTLQPGQVTPWHIHPDGHEITYVMEGSVKIQIDKEPD